MTKVEELIKRLTYISLHVDEVGQGRVEAEIGKELLSYLGEISHTDNLEEFLVFMRDVGWDQLEAYFYNATEDEWIIMALEKYALWKESR